ncbi:MAG: hypothetical protein HeimC2_11370 [Candidatus Heimdallarchaeota archaeon LC_2]|nr:MAG: hypothetical protein HeimC2_11370 [Candidatus Heimdallarchaeota archaeon LC_2]
MIEYNDIIDNGAPIVSSTLGKILQEIANVSTIEFTVTENHFEKYELYQNQTLFSGGFEELSVWKFEVPVTYSNTTWTLKIFDELGNEGTGGTWVYINPELLETSTNEGDGDESPLDINSSYVFLSIVTLVIIRKISKAKE